MLTRNIVLMFCLHTFCFLQNLGQIIQENQYKSSSSDSIEQSKNGKTSWKQNSFTKSFIIDHQRGNIFIQINFTSLAENQSFPLVTLCLNFPCYFSLFGGDSSYELVFVKQNFESYFFTKSIHYLTLLSSEFKDEDVIYLTIFNLFSNSSEIEFTISYVQNESVSNCSDIWSNYDCSLKSHYFKQSYLPMGTDESTNVVEGKPKNFYYKFSGSPSSYFNLETSSSIFLIQQFTNEEDDTNFFFDTSNIYYIQTSYSTNLDALTSSTSSQSSDLYFMLLCPWFDENNEANVEISLKRSSNVYDLDMTKIKEIISGVVTLAGAVCLICIFFFIIKVIRKHRSRMRRAEENRLEIKIDADTVQTNFPVKSFKLFKNEINHHECSICLQNFVEEDNCRELFCFHAFHQKCIDLWILTHQTCPFCRREYNVFTIKKEKAEFMQKIKARAELSNRNAAQTLITINNNGD